MSIPSHDTSSECTTVYFDGACPVCSREVKLYTRLDRKGAVEWHDVSISQGDLERDGVTQADALARLHARLPNGQLVTGVSAFLAIWKMLPGFRLLVPFARWRPIRWLLERAYDWFAPRRTRLMSRLKRA